jgi:superfamily II DNA or RNA helicase
MPNKSEIQQGDDISLEFVKPLRDYQDNIINVYMDYVSKPICNGSQHNGSGGILEVPCGRGKTIMALKIISLLKKKTLIIVHKEFLMNQWIERIRDFVPSARVGKIQASVFDIEDKDIVIGMIQTIYSREYASNTFNSFGLTIIDEVHRIGSEEFSKTLFKISTRYMLGISATVERKDGLTEILYMFIGPRIYTETRKENDEVEVRAIQYDHSHAEYKTEEFDFRGNIKYSTMINRISDFPPRQQFLVKILEDLIEENSEKQIMVLSHKRDLLKFLHDEINNNKIASCGYYIGGMKQEYLQNTENQQIVLATYAMAAEALDIKSLNTSISPP